MSEIPTDIDQAPATAHLVRSTQTKEGRARKRSGPWHLSSFGPVTLCGEPLDLSTVHRLDLTRARLLGPDVCTDCTGVFSPDDAAEAQRRSDAGADEQLDDELGGIESGPARDAGQGKS